MPRDAPLWETEVGWERGRYYTRSRRVDGRVVREYVGMGVLAQLEADRDRERRIQHEEERRAWLGERDIIESLEAASEGLDHLCSLLMGAELEAAGYHQHDRGQWRRRRG